MVPVAPAASATMVPLGLTLNVQPGGGGGGADPTAACVTSTRTPATTTEPVRVAPGFDETLTVACPGPVPGAPCEMTSQSASLAAVHEHPAGP